MRVTACARRAASSRARRIRRTQRVGTVEHRSTRAASSGCARRGLVARGTPRILRRGTPRILRSSTPRIQRRAELHRAASVPVPCAMIGPSGTVTM